MGLGVFGMGEGGGGIVCVGRKWLHGYMCSNLKSLNTLSLNTFSRSRVIGSVALWALLKRNT